MKKQRNHRRKRWSQGIAAFLTLTVICSFCFMQVLAEEQMEPAAVQATEEQAENAVTEDPMDPTQDTGSGTTDPSEGEKMEPADETGQLEPELTEQPGTEPEAEGPESELTEQPGTEAETEEPEATDLAGAAPLALSLASTQAQTAPEHHKYIRSNGNDGYTLTLDVKGTYDAQVSKPKLDVVLVVDCSGSMAWNMSGQAIGDGQGQGDGPSRMEILKDVITEGEKSLSQSILGNSQIDARMALVGYSGNGDSNFMGFWWGDTWDDASSRLDGTWTTSKTDLDTAADNLAADGGTNCQAGLRTAAEVLTTAREDAQKVVIFLSDGEPTFRYTSGGYTTGNGNNDSQGYNAAAAYSQAESMSGLSGFYVVGISSRSSMQQTPQWTTFLQTLSGKPQAAKNGYYHSTDADKLAEDFQKIVADMTEYTCRNVTITDTLSSYAQPADAANFQPTVKITNAAGEQVLAVDVNGTTVKAEDLLQISYNGTTRQVTAAFPEGYILDPNYTYAVSFDIVPTQLAYDTYAEGIALGGTGYNAVGSTGSDAPGNATSAGKNGFYSNADYEQDHAGAVLAYTYGTQDHAESYTAVYAEKPVLQVSSLHIPVQKVWENMENVAEEDWPEQITVNLYQDESETVYRSVNLKRNENWSGWFTAVAKGHTYTVREASVPSGYESVVTGDTENGFRITNTHLPSLSISKEVTGDMGDRTKAFSFVIQLKDAEGKPVSGSFSYTGSSVSEDIEEPKAGVLQFSEQGTATVMLKHGQEVTINGLPLNAAYVVAEQNADGYETYYDKEKADQAEGELTADQTVEVVNEKGWIPVTGLTEEHNGSLAIGAAAILLAVLAAGWFLLRRKRVS